MRKFIKRQIDRDKENKQNDLRSSTIYTPSSYIPRPGSPSTVMSLYTPTIADTGPGISSPSDGYTRLGDPDDIYAERGYASGYVPPPMPIDRYGYTPPKSTDSDYIPYFHSLPTKSTTTVSDDSTFQTIDIDIEPTPKKAADHSKVDQHGPMRGVRPFQRSVDPTEKPRPKTEIVEIKKEVPNYRPASEVTLNPNDPALVAAVEQAIKRYTVAGNIDRKTIAIEALKNLQGETAVKTDYEAEHPRYETVDFADLERFKKMQLAPENVAASGNAASRVENVAVGALVKVENAASAESKSPSFETETPKSNLSQGTQPVRSRDDNEKWSKPNQKFDPTVKEDPSEDLESDFESDAESDDEDLDRHREAFYAAEVKTCLEDLNFSQLEDIARRSMQRKQHGTVSVAYENDREAVWKLILALALFGQCKVQDCLNTLTQIHLSSAGGPRGKRAGGTGVSDDDIRAGVYFAYAASLMLLGRHEEAKTKCQRAIRLTKSASAEWTSEYLKVIAKDVEKPSPDTLAHRPTELLAMILEKSGNDLDSRFYRSMLPKDYEQSEGVIMMIQVVDKLIAEEALFKANTSATAAQTSMGVLEKSEIIKSDRELLEKLFSMSRDKISLTGMLLEGSTDALMDLASATILNPDRSSDSPPLSDVLWQYPLVFGKDKTPLHALRDSTGSTPLHYAASGGDRRAVDLLLDASADFKATNDLGYNALHCAAMATNPTREHGDITRALLMRGADANTRVIPSLPLRFSNEEIPFNDYTPLMIAATNGNVFVLEALLQYKADPTLSGNLQSKRNTPLHLAVENNHEAFVRTLVNAPGVNINALNTSDQTPLLIAVANAKPIIVGILLSAGAIPNVKDKNGKIKSAMHVALGLPQTAAREQLLGLLGNWESCKQS